MDRRDFLTTCAAAAGSVALAPMARGQERPSAGPFTDAPLKISLPPSWFEGTIEEQLKQIASWGLPAYEWLGPKGDLPALRQAADALGLELSCILGVGAIAPGQMVDPAQHDRLLEQFKERVALAKQLRCRRLIGLTGNTSIDATHDQQTTHVIECLRRLAPLAEENDVEIVMEALNPLVNHKGFFLTRTDQTMMILDAVDSPNVKMCFDIYHQQITEGNIIRNITENIARIGHFHVGDNPGRKEPGTGELNYRNIFKAIHGTGYDGFVAMECGRSGTTEEALNKLLDCLNWS